MAVTEQSISSFKYKIAMKRIFFILLTLLIVSGISAQNSSKVFIPAERVHNFGKIMEKDGKVSTVFQFKNIGKRPIVIENVSAWCGCTTYSFTKTPIKPGTKGEVKVTYNPYNRPGFFSKEIVILTEGGSSYTRVWVKGNVIPFQHPVTEDYPYAFGQGLYLSLKVLAFGALRKGESQSIILGYANNNNKQIKLTFKVEPENANIKFIYPNIISAKGRSKMTFTYTTPRNGRPNKNFKIYPVINGKKLSKAIDVTFLK